MKLLRVKANHFKNCSDGYTIDFVAKSRKYPEDKEYELQEIAPELHIILWHLLERMLQEKHLQLIF